MGICSFPAIGFDWIPSLFLTIACVVAMANGRKARREYETYLVESWRLQTMPIHESKRMTQVHEADAKPCAGKIQKGTHI